MPFPSLFFSFSTLHPRSLVVAVLIAQGFSDPTQYSLFRGFIDMGAGLSVGLSGLAAGFAIGIVGDSGVRGTAQQPRYA